MAGDAYDTFEYKDISELKRELESIKGRKDVSNKELYEAVQRLAQVMGGIVEVFGTAAEQMNLEEREFESSAKKHEMILTKLDKLISQNKTIAEGVVTVIGIAKENIAAAPKEKEDSSMFRQKEDESELFKPKIEPKPFAEPSFFVKPPAPQQDWQPASSQTMPKIERFMPRMQQPTMAPPMMPPMQHMAPASAAATPSDFELGMQMPPMEPEPVPDLELDFGKDLAPLDEEPKKKGLFGMFKK